MNTSAAQWWVWRINRPARTSSDRCTVDPYASLTRAPCSAASLPW